MKRMLSCVLIAALMLLPMSGCKAVDCVIYDAQGERLASLSDRASLEGDSRRAYLEIVVDEAVTILAELEGCDEGKAERLLLANGYSVTTAFDAEVTASLEEAVAARESSSPLGCAVTDLEGHLLAVYSTDETVNYAAVDTAPYSSFKPLSVYMQAIENGVANWSTLYRDSAYKQLTDETGATVPWPQNSTGAYSKENVTVYEALRQSLNTVAVKCLKDVGVDKSISFLQSKLGLPLDEEAYVSMIYGEEEIIGNVALGYLSEGVSPVDMAGYYQIFANGGLYTKPQAVLTITDPNGQVIYERQDTASQVIHPTTAQIMNRLLQGVVSAGGTGAQAACETVEVAGKTGTGDNNTGNWFVGVTPHYSCAVWHGEDDLNTAPSCFSEIMNEIYTRVEHQNTRFITRAALQTKAYCTESGMVASPSCRLIDMGYYADADVPDVCDRHDNKN